jgi:hypothetical protein
MMQARHGPFLSTKLVKVKSSSGPVTIICGHVIAKTRFHIQLVVRIGGSENPWPRGFVGQTPRVHCYVNGLAGIFF